MRAYIGSLVLVSAFALGCSASAESSAPESSDAVIADGVLALADSLPEQCASDEIVRIRRPVSSADPSRGSYAYGFRFKAPTAPGAPVLVYLPGGPGSSSTDKPPTFVPEGWGYLLTDPRGVGCNTLARVPSAEISSLFFQTKEIAEDVIAAIRQQKLDAYILFGLSYGTLLGTTVAYGIEAQGVAPPKAVVLEGVLGEAFPSSYMGDEYIKQWDRVRGVLPADVLTELDTKDVPYGVDAEGWSRALMALLMAGPNVTANLVASLSTTLNIPEESRQVALSQITRIAAQHPHTEPGAVELYREVACREIMDNVPANDLDVVFTRGKLVPNLAEAGTKCGDAHLVTPFDSAKLPFAAKLYDFIGSVDVATPTWQGAYHFEHHQGGPAVRIVSQGAGHNSLEHDQVQCAPQLMASIWAGGTDIRTVAQTCPLATAIDTR
jgi:pimeloyl-ACP methyl ester carboxylesterase